MKKILKGFTLAEVLVTLSIVGIIAALTLPSLTLNVQKQQIPPALAKAINTLESANKLALQQNNARKLSELVPTTYDDKNKPVKDFSSNYFETILAPYLKITSNTDTINYKPLFTNINVSISDGYITIDGMLMRTGTISDSKIRDGALGFILIDVNGKKGPNITGLDLLGLVVMEDGSVYGLGSKQYYTQDAVTCGKGGDAAFNDYACAGRIVDDGYKITY